MQPGQANTYYRSGKARRVRRDAASCSLRHSLMKYARQPQSTVPAAHAMPLSTPTAALYFGSHTSRADEGEGGTEDRERKDNGGNVTEKVAISVNIEPKSMSQPLCTHPEPGRSPFRRSR